MRQEWDAVVAGAGIIGLAAGRELARRGARVLIVDAGRLCGGATQASAGMLAPHIEAAGHDVLHQLTVRSLSLYDRFVADLEQEAGTTIEYARRGTLELAYTETAAARLAGQAAALESAGVAARLLSGTEAAGLESAIAEPAAGLFVGTHGYVRVAQLTSALLAAARAAGASVIEEQRVEPSVPRPDAPLRLVIGGEEHFAGTLVVAAGSWSGNLLDRGPAVTPVRGQLLQLAWKGPAIGRVLWSDDCYVVPWSDGQVLVGATVEDAGFDQRTTVAGVRALMDAACRLLPAAGEASFVEARAGLRPGTPDGLPYIGRSARHPGVVYATGHYRNGILLAPLTAALVADLVLDGRSDAMLAAAAPDR